MFPARTATARQAALLLDPALDPLLSALARAGEGGVGAADLARRAGTPLSTTHARLERLRAAGVVVEVGQRTRSGRPVRLYCLPLPWQIPFEVTPAAGLRELLGGGFERRLRGHLDQLAGRMDVLGERWSMTLDCSESGELLHIFGHDGGGGHPLPPEPLLASGADLRLTTARAGELQRRLWELLEEYSHAQDSGEVPTWSVTMLLTPEIGDGG
ncbi:helix-turn-helix domain-containing protein [Deinococcus sp. SDU3-2]|uniref:Helix-turn-helix domain-containing protein n=1 Tax=Deinococcus terrestris TaxID=2651870 RepID=A0A7X1TRB8_9DEIO|nr:helix-turn-helix domain-containing protein [Deinococcus terrestris]MPY66628.1 helix-turn-helix domain-containing protein [Deinococcus terrestris]